MVLLYEKDAGLAAAVARGLAERGHEVRRCESFLTVRDLAPQLRPAAVLFAVDQNSLGTFGALRRALDPDVPVVATGKRRHLYVAFAGLHANAALGGFSAAASRLVPERFWFVEAPVAPQAACDAVERAIREAAVPRQGARRWRRFLGFALLGLGLGGALVAAAGVFLHWGERAWRVGAALAWGSMAGAYALPALAASRIGLRPPGWVLALASLFLLVALGEAVRVFFPFR